MPQLTPYFLTFGNGLHLGVRGVNLEESATQLPADTLFAALVDAWRRSGRDLLQLTGGFTAQPVAPPFLLTSAFPFAGGVRFYPMPVDLSRLFSAQTLKDRGKEIKRIRYLSEALLRRSLTGERLDDWLFPEKEHETPKRGVALQAGALWLTSQEVQALPATMQRRHLHAVRQQTVYAAERRPRVTVDRINSASTIYHVGRTSFAPECGLWFGVEQRADRAASGASGDSWRVLIAQALALLADDGLGGERSSGYGGFRWTTGAAFDLPHAQPGKPALLLSRYHPTKDELPAALTDPAAAYALTPVGGWLRSPDAAGQRRKRLMLVGEGSIVCPPHGLAGDVVDVRPEYSAGPGVAHPIYRYGLALCVDASKLPEATHG